MSELIIRLIERSSNHDKSKLVDPELDTFDRCTARLKDLTYGSEEYKEALADMGPALQHHYANNRHHPEYFGEEGINGMNLLDLIEMLCDWKAATLRHLDGDIAKSITINQERFKISPQLTKILLNTAVDLFWLKSE